MLREKFLEILCSEFISRLHGDWPLWARPNQRPALDAWRTWLLLGGRGAGKTRTGAEWLKGVVEQDQHFPGHAAGRVALVGESYNDARDVMVEGESGLLGLYRKSDRPQWRVSRRELVWPNGTIGQLFSASDPDGLRGKQFGASWADAKTVWGGLVAVGAAVAGSMGVTIDPGTQNDLADAIVRLAGALGGLVAIYGRLSATDIIS